MQNDITQALDRIAQYSTNQSVTRLEWWLHPDRAAMRDAPHWSSVFFHLSLANEDRPIRQNVGQLVESCCGSPPLSFMVVDTPNTPNTALRQSSNVHAVAGAGEFCRVSAEGGPVLQSTLISEEKVA